MVGLKARAMEHSSNILPATTNGIHFNGQLSADNTTKTSSMGSESEIKTCLHVFKRCQS